MYSWCVNQFHDPEAKAEWVFGLLNDPLPSELVRDVPVSQEIVDEEMAAWSSLQQATRG